MENVTNHIHWTWAVQWLRNLRKNTINTNSGKKAIENNMKNNKWNRSFIWIERSLVADILLTMTCWFEHINSYFQWISTNWYKEEKRNKIKKKTKEKKRIEWPSLKSHWLFHQRRSEERRWVRFRLLAHYKQWDTHLFPLRWRNQQLFYSLSIRFFWLEFEDNGFCIASNDLAIYLQFKISIKKCQCDGYVTLEIWCCCSFNRKILRWINFSVECSY